MTTARVSVLLGALLGVILAAALPAGAQAADLGYGSIKDEYAPPPPPRRTWYLKGTIGMHNHEVGSMWNDVYANGFFTVHHTDMKTAPFFGLGVGVERGRWLRFDLTGEYRGKFIFLGEDSYTNAGGGTNEFTADIESWLGLFNAYIDLGTWRGVTPYIGAGAGVATLSVLGLKDVNVPNNSVFFGADNTEVNFAWALYAGMSYDVTAQFTLDLAYRYADLGDAESGRVRAYDGSSSYRAQEIRDVTSHDIMLSMRYRLDQPAEYPVVLK
jgi:opacity protein-like surface antigen